MLKMSKVLNVEMDIDELRNDDFRYGILNKDKIACQAVHCYNIKFTKSNLGVIDGRFSLF